MSARQSETMALVYYRGMKQENLYDEGYRKRG